MLIISDLLGDTVPSVVVLNQCSSRLVVGDGAAEGAVLRMRYKTEDLNTFGQ